MEEESTETSAGREGFLEEAGLGEPRESIRPWTTAERARRAPWATSNWGQRREEPGSAVPPSSSVKHRYCKNPGFMGSW